MKKSTVYFNMSSEELKQKKDCGYTKEECLLLDASIKTCFFDSIENLKNAKTYYIRSFDICDIIQMTDGRFALLLF